MSALIPIRGADEKRSSNQDKNFLGSWTAHNACPINDLTFPLDGGIVSAKIAPLRRLELTVSSEPPPSKEVTRLLASWSQGDPSAREALMPLVYGELRRLAASYLRKERSDHTLQPTALVHEAYLRLVEQKNVQWQDRGHFFAITAQLMRRILVDHARSLWSDNWRIWPVVGIKRC